ncbi:MAG: hypothetical protein V4450_14455 [Bacteroidota bacterium]
MKTLARIFSVILAFVLTLSASASVMTGEPDSEKSKSYSKSYPVGSGDKITLDNSFGEMKISTWSKNEIKVDVSITAKASTDEYAQKIIDMISIEDGKNGSEIFFKTRLKGNERSRDDKEDRKEKNTSFKINYTVYLPANATLDATNQFGSLVIGDFDGAANLTAKFGSLTAGKLSQPKRVRVEFGSATVESMNGGKIDVRFSSAQFNKLSGEITADFEQSHNAKINLDNNLKKIDIKVNFSDLLLDADKNFSASYKIKNSLGSFSNKSDFSIPKQEDDNHRYFNKNEVYNGKSGSGSTPVDIKNNFGHITIGHNLPFDINDKAKNKHEKKIKV